MKNCIFTCVFNNKKYIDEKFLTQILDSYVFEEGKSYSDFQEGDEVSSTKASDLVTNKEPELKVYLSEETLCVDTINSVNKTAFSERSKLLILGVASGFNIYDFYIYLFCFYLLLNGEHNKMFETRRVFQ